MYFVLCHERFEIGTTRQASCYTDKPGRPRIVLTETCICSFGTRNATAHGDGLVPQLFPNTKTYSSKTSYLTGLSLLFKITGSLVNSKRQFLPLSHLVKSKRQFLPLTRHKFC